MRIELAALLLAAPILGVPQVVLAADLRDPGISLPNGDSRFGGPSYGDLWRRSHPLPPGPRRPYRRVMGDVDYVGSDYGLGKPAYSGIGSRPDWGRSSYD